MGPVKNIDRSLFSDFEKIYREYYRKIYNYAYACFLHREEAEDATDEIFMAILENLHRFDEEKGKLSTWIWVVARHRVQDRFRKAYHRKEIPVNEVQETEAETAQFLSDENSLQQVENRKLYQILKRLSDAEREFLVLRYEMELDNGEIAQLLGISRDTVCMRYVRLLRKCRSLYEEIEKIEKFFS